jgi:hypothetical protein
MAQFNQLFYGAPEEVSPASQQSPLLGMDVENDVLYVNSGNGWIEVGGSSGGVSSVNSVTGAVVVEAGSSGTVGVTTSGQDVKIDATTATTSQLGVVKPDGSTIDVASGVISVPTATTSALGLVKPDGSTIDVTAGVISVPTATTSALGIVKPDGSTITISSGVISAAGGSGGLTKIAQTVLGSAAASITFSSIPGSYTNLLIEIFGQSAGTSVNDTILAQFNGDTAAHYDVGYTQGGAFGATAGTSQNTNGVWAGLLTCSSVSSDAGQSSVVINNYAATVSYKRLKSVWDMTDFSDGDIANGIYSGRWRSTAAITEIVLTLTSSSNFEAGTTATLYGY